LNKAVRHDFYSSSHIFRVIKSRRILGVERGKGKKNITNTCKALLEKLREREFLRLETSGLDSFGSNRDQLRVFVPRMMNFLIS